MKSTEAGFENDYPTAAGVGDTQILMRFEVQADGPAIPPDAPFLIAPILPLSGNHLARIDRPLAGPRAGSRRLGLNFSRAAFCSSVS